MRNSLKIVLISVYLMAGLSACSDNNDLAPVTDASYHKGNLGEPIGPSGRHQVIHGETLYAIAWRYGMDYRDLARLNHLSPPYHLKAGQWISLRVNAKRKKPSTYPVLHPSHPNEYPKNLVLKRTNPAPQLSNKNQNKNVGEKVSLKQPTAGVAKQAMSQPISREAPTVSHSSKGGWLWPAKGKVIQYYSPAQGSKGIDIAGNKGDAVLASAAGVVAYSGTGIRGYGQLLIIKHNSEYLSAYAHNNSVKVKEGDRVKAGQIIAEMGSSGSNRVMLHFELRRAGQPVDPIRYLNK